MVGRLALMRNPILADCSLLPSGSVRWSDSQDVSNQITQAAFLPSPASASPTPPKTPHTPKISHPFFAKTTPIYWLRNVTNCCSTAYRHHLIFRHRCMYDGDSCIPRDKTEDEAPQRKESTRKVPGGPSADVEVETIDMKFRGNGNLRTTSSTGMKIRGLVVVICEDLVF